MPINGYLGGVISATAPTVNNSGASGVFTLDEQLQYAGQNLWPGYQISRSVRLRSSASAYLSRTPASAGSLTTWTWSGWIKRGTLGALQAIFSSGTSNITLVSFQADDTLRIRNSTVEYITTQVFRDPAAWHHIVLQWNTTNGTAANRVLLYVNGSQVTSFSTQTTAASSEQSEWNKAQSNQIGRYAFNGTSYFDGYLTEINFIDGQALTPSSFGTTDAVTGVWNPIRYTGTYGNNGFYLNFSDNSGATATTIGKDSSGNGNNWTPNNISVTAGTTYDSMVDVPIGYGSDTGAGGEVRGNFCVWNPINIETSTTISEANLKFLCSSGSSYNTCTGTISVSSGKWYWELTYTGASGDGSQTGILASTRNLAGLTTSAATGTWSDGYAYSSNGNKVNNGSGSAYGSTYTTGDVIGVALDLNAGTLVFYKNNTSQGTAYSSLSGSFVPSAGSFNSNYYQANFGQRPFSYTAPSGFKALCTQNLPAASIVNGANYMAASLYTGTGASQTVSNAVNGISFQPDLVWIKSRSAATDHKLTDSVRGATKALISDTAGAETTDTNGLTAFGSSGFTVGTDTVYNNNTATYVGWQWKGGGTAVSNTAGSITSSVSANTTAGCSVVTYTFSTSATNTIGHGLGVAPSMIIMKDRTTAYNWDVYHVSVGYTQRLILNSTSAATSGYWAAAPTSTVFSVTTSAYTNNDNIVAYCFAPIAGYSAFGSYTGNGSTDGPFVYTGMRVRWLMVKCSSSTDGGNGDWLMYDTSRNSYNVMNSRLWADLSSAEASASGYYYDFLSNGFKVRTGDANYGSNTSGQTYIYAAFAENPFNISRAR